MKKIRRKNLIAIEYILPVKEQDDVKNIEVTLQESIFSFSSSFY